MNVFSCLRSSCCLNVTRASLQHKARYYLRKTQLGPDLLIGRSRKIKITSAYTHRLLQTPEIIPLQTLRNLSSINSNLTMAKKSASANKSSSKETRAKTTTKTASIKKEELQVQAEKPLKRKLDQKSKSAKKIKTSISESSKEDDNTDVEGDIHGENKIESCGDFISRIQQKRAAVCESVAKFKFNKKRVRVITKTEEFSPSTNGVLYWMSRDQRVQDNWAFLYAQRLAMKLEVPLYVSFCLMPTFLDATIRHFRFMMKGLAQVEKECRELNIPFYLLLGEASSAIPAFVKKHNIGGVVTDFSPLRVPLKWLNDLKSALPQEVPLCQVDAHNLVPCWEASPKLEYAARTIRTKINSQLGLFLTEFPPLVKHPHSPIKMPDATDWEAADGYLTVDRSVKEVAWAVPGTEHGLRMLESFCESRLKDFSTLRNDPTKEALSNLSPWLHFGQLSAQRCILTVKSYRSKFSESVNAFIEEAVIRRELADNFCFYNEKYDSLEGAYDWAQKSLDIHRKDKRPYLYSREQLEQGKTHDTLWNAAQIQMVTVGKMHGFLRMYWAKKILEWTKSPEEALAEAIYLNDKYNLDGRDPNGYVGCMWSICGMHDHQWTEKAIFGKVRYMNYSTCKRKFHVETFINQNSNKT